LKISHKNLSYLAVGLVPAAVYLAPVLASSFPPDATFASVITALPLLAFTAVGFLGWKLNQTRILVSALVLLGVFHLLRHPDALLSLGVGRIRLPQILATCLPLIFSLVFLVKENRLWSGQTLAQLILAAAPVAFFITMLNTVPASFDRLFGAQLFSLPLQTPQPQIGLASMAALGFTTWLVADIKVRPFLVALLWCLLPLIFVFHISLSTGMDPGQVAFYQDLSLLSMSAILLHTIFSMYWHRVYIDELTSVPNRRALDERLYRLSGNYALAMVDIDHFKAFNDTYGHDEGDNVLRLVARHMHEETRGRTYRYGGEEFCTVFENEGLEQAEKVMDRCRALLAKREFHVRKAPARRKAGKDAKKRGKGDGKILRIHVSIGIAAPGKKAAGPEDVIKLADKALYKAKESGRNQVVVA
jgi:diguanylate cyclase (GGDEF)-like protein